LEELPGVKKAQASHPEKRAEVVYDESIVTLEEICRALFRAGFVAGPIAEMSGAIMPPDSRVAEGREIQATDIICYCFGYTRWDIERDFINNGRSLILGKISAEKKAGGCDCAAKNPNGR
jgi:copper chaperone CopZ